MLTSKCKDVMKKLRIYILTLAAGLLMIPMSCTKDFLETRPTDQLSGGEVFTTISGAWGAINGVHRLMYIQYNSHRTMVVLQVYTSTSTGWDQTSFSIILPAPGS
jgi:hypothetical protein